MDTNFDDRIARNNIGVLVLGQAILGAQLPLVFTVAGLSGQSLAPNPCLATLPITMIVACSMLCAPLMSTIMQRYGRRPGFYLGITGGALGGCLGALGLYLNSFEVFLIGSICTGVYMSAQGFYRFAATDVVSENTRAKAISFVMAGGLFAALIGPQLVKLSADAFVVPFLGTYLVVMGLNFIGIFLFPWLKIPRPAQVSKSEYQGRSRLELIKSPIIASSMIAAMVSYALMNLVMTATPLAVVGCGFSKNNAADIVSAHVIAMYLPSFFTGHLIARFGVKRIIALGLLILGLAGIVALSGLTLLNFFGALILLGIGWNFGFIGATTLLTSAHSAEERGRLQGMNDFFVFGGVTVASISSGGLLNCSGGGTVAGWTAVNLAMVPFLLLAAGALFWMTKVARKSRPAPV